MIACYFVVIKVLWSSTKTIERLTAHSGGSGGRRVNGGSNAGILGIGRQRGSTESTSCVSVDLVKSGSIHIRTTTTTTATATATPSTSCSSLLVTNG